MIEWFLRAKHWQLALIFMAIFALMPIFFASYFINVINNTDPFMNDPAAMHFPFWMFVPLVLLLAYDFLYYWSVGMGLHGLIKEPGKLKLKYLQWALAYPIIYMSVALGLSLTFVFSVDGMLFEPGPNMIVIMLLAIPLHLLAIFCGFYKIYFMARLVKSVELGRTARLDEAIVEGVLFWFYFIGIWIIQPKVNEFYEKSLSTPDSEV